MKATITEVAIGHLSLPGLMSEKGDFGVAVPQVSESFQIAKGHASRDFKAMLGADFQFAKWITPLHPKAVNVLTLDQFQRIVRALDKAGNPGARAFVDALFGLSLHQLFCDAFHVKVTADDRQQQLKESAKNQVFMGESDRLIWDFRVKSGLPIFPSDTDPVVAANYLYAQQVELDKRIQAIESRYGQAKASLLLSAQSESEIGEVAAKVIQSRAGKTIFRWEEIRQLGRRGTTALRKTECLDILDLLQKDGYGRWNGSPGKSPFYVFPRS